MYLILFLRVANIIAEFNNFTIYANLFQDISLPCTSSVVPRWRKDGILMSDGIAITDDMKFHHRLKVANNSVLKTYNLQIKNITLHDKGHYVCEVQRQSYTEIAQEGLSKKSEKEASFPPELSATQTILATSSNTDNSVPTNTSNQTKTYGLLAAGFVAVLLITTGCNMCICKYRNKAMRLQIKQQIVEIHNLKNRNDSIHELGSVGDISNVSSRYETIDEKDMCTRNLKDHEHRIQGQTLNRQVSSVFDDSYLEVIGVDVYSACNEEMVESSSMLNTKMINVMTTGPYKANNIDTDVASCHSTVSKQFDESEMLLVSNCSIHVDTDSACNFINTKINFDKKGECMNPYLLLNTSDIDKTQNYYTSLDPNIESGFQKEK